MLPTRITEERETPRPGLRPPQFSLRTLMLVVSFLGLYFAWVPYMSPVVHMALWLSVSVIGAHLAGAHFGMRLRESADMAPRRQRNHSSGNRAAELPPRIATSPLVKRRKTGWAMFLILISGATLGGIAGAALAKWQYGDQAELPHCLVAAAAFATFGGAGAFLLGGFLHTSAVGLKDALREGK